MKKNDCLCRRYTFKDALTSETFEVFIGYKLLREPSSSGPGQFTMVKLNRTVTDGKAENWSETKLEGPFEANGPDTIPMSYKDKESQYVSQFLSQGYTFLDEVLVNAETQTVLEGGSVSAGQTASLGSLNWLLSPPSELPPGDINLFKGFVAGVFAKGAGLIGFEVARSEGSNDLLPSVLMRTDSGYELGVSTGLGENTIHPATLEGAGELRPEHGHKPLLMLVYLQQRFADDFSNVEKPLVAFCDEQGDTFDYERFDSLKPLIERFGFSYDEVRADAERLGLVSELIRLAEIDAEQEDHFF
ncbi:MULTISPECIES: hypothetical protein [Gammaproteobacteria]|uniref:Uncharacterized protein n=2 Tax=Gammaproteobacteria TaxID=1236 RepID=V9SHW3_VIBCL|nr:MULTISPECIES: hypothetical protein [Gammaproteobacteria]EAX1870527.1 hypothetical protein [Salmonella enterica]EBH8544593.1 hypothetical protein [Salmonella enterica subsp. enterica serovar Oranienburg]ECM8277607.1 hypothetical protein [Salmonella enterica subsp. enterica serovar Infantis]ERF93812.1 hypothetical protein SEEHRA23_06415 [Salmonella enterica subsp. enterica serovar Heidelberg str. SARA33]CAJ0563646.1 hypothetical protein DJICPGNB_19425 [Proteus mirabilis]HAE8467373.1 hypothet